MSDKLVLYSYWRSSCSYRVRIALNLKGLEYEYKAVHLRNGDQKSENFSELNPNQVVPVLVVDGKPLSQSLSIIEFIDKKWPSDVSFYPQDLFQRSEATALAQSIACDIQPLQNFRVLGMVSSEMSVKTQWAKDINQSGLSRFEKLIAKTAGKYCYGDQLTIADICLVPQVYNAIRFGVDLKQFPHIDRIYNELIQLEAFKKASPEAQPDVESA